MNYFECKNPLFFDRDNGSDAIRYIYNTIMEEVQKQSPRIGLVGSGSFGTAMAKILSEGEDAFYWWIRSEYKKTYIAHEHRNPNYLSGVEFNPKKLILSIDINELVQNCDILIFVVPSIYLADCLNDLTVPLNNKLIVTGIKGIVPGTTDIVGDYFHKELNVAYENIGVIAGPCHAEEIALERLSYLTVAFEDKANAKILAKRLTCDYVNVTLSNDIIGTEYAAVIKNIYAIACGISHGLGYGDNFQSVLLSNAIREMKSFLDEVSPKKRNINNTAYLGDLLVTGYSFFSRNRMLGNMIGKGYTVKSALMEMNMVPEGYYATDGIYAIMKEHGLDLPIIKTVYKILHDEKNPKKRIQKLARKLT